MKKKQITPIIMHRYSQASIFMFVSFNFSAIVPSDLRQVTVKIGSHTHHTHSLSEVYVV